MLFCLANSVRMDSLRTHSRELIGQGEHSPQRSLGHFPVQLVIVFSYYAAANYMISHLQSFSVSSASGLNRRTLA